MTVSVQSQAAAEAVLPAELRFRDAKEEVEQALVGLIPLPQHLGERQVPVTPGTVISDSVRPA